jgi:amino acid adenylation domain-containing protein
MSNLLPTQASIVSAVFVTANEQPDNIALCEADKSLSYAQLSQAIEQLRSALTQQPCHRVIIALDRGIEATVAIFATLASGGCYIPIDLKSPDDRLAFISEDADAQCVIGNGPRPSWLMPAQCWLDIATLLSDSPTTPCNHQSRPFEPESLAAILYTSGSTGTPKGVALSHRAISNFAYWAGTTFSIDATDRVASLAPFYFDLSVFDLFTSLAAGASVHFIPVQLTLSPSRLTQWLSAQVITTWYTVPSLLSFIALKGALDTTPLPNLQTLLFAGEVLPTTTLIKLCKQLPQVEFYNLYGPTETNVCCYWPVDNSRLTVDQPIPIGIPACNANLSINPDNDELLVKSDNNFSGYWQQGKLVPCLTHDKQYATGDKVSKNEFGEYCYHGRLDRMLKCSGYRVEPAEIELIMQRSTDLSNCAVVGIKDITSGQRPAAAIVLSPGGKLDTIVKHCRQHLPAYMQPIRFIVLPELPYLSTGKVDYRSLQIQLETHT